MSVIKFVEGLWFNKPHENAAPFNKGQISFDLKRFFEWAREWKKDNPDEKYLKLALLESKEGTYYAKVDDWKPGEKTEATQSQPDNTDDFDDDIPF